MTESYEGMWLELEVQDALINCASFEQLLALMDYDKPLEGYDASKMPEWGVVEEPSDG